ncbi:MAG TPA: RDD family protein [Bacteroidales bacterium]|nr:RDD family protein [Bacteroidales bacterium]
MNYTSRHEIHTSNEFVLASIKRRFFNFIIDWTVLVLIYFMIILVFSLFGMNLSKIDVKGIFEVDLDISNASHSFVTVMKVFFGLLPAIYFTVSFYFFHGRSIGKYFCSLQVVSLYHKRIGLWHCFERSLGYFASGLEFGFGYIQAIWNPNRMSLHDKIGETIVVKLPKKIKIEIKPVKKALPVTKEPDKTEPAHS